MRLIVRKALNFVNRNDQSFRKIWGEFRKTSKIGPSMESLNADFFQYSAKSIKGFVLRS